MAKIFEKESSMIRGPGDPGRLTLTATFGILSKERKTRYYLGKRKTCCFIYLRRIKARLEGPSQPNVSSARVFSHTIMDL